MAEQKQTIHCLFCRAVILFGGLPAQRYQDHFVTEHNILTYDTSKLVHQTLAEEWPDLYGKKDANHQTEEIVLATVAVQVDLIGEIALAGIEDSSGLYNTEVESCLSEDDSMHIEPLHESDCQKGSQCFDDEIEENIYVTRTLRSDNSKSLYISQNHKNESHKLLGSIWECKENYSLQIIEEDSYWNKSFFNCKICCTRFLTGVRETHLKLKHDFSYSEYIEKFGETNELKMHNCFICKKDVLWDRISLQKHFTTSHNKTLSEYFKKYNTKICETDPVINEEESKLPWYERHGFNCGICGSIYSCKSNCDRHIQVKHGLSIVEYAVKYGDLKQIEQFSCEICYTTFPWIKKTIKNHLEGNHFLSLDNYGKLYIDKGKSLKRKAESNADSIKKMGCRIMCKKINPSFLKLKYEPEIASESEDDVSSQDCDYSGLSYSDLGKCVDNIIEEMFDVEPKVSKSDNCSPLTTSAQLDVDFITNIPHTSVGNVNDDTMEDEPLVTNLIGKDILNDDDLTDGLSSITSQECHDEIFNEDPTSDFEDIENLLSDDETISGNPNSELREQRKFSCASPNFHGFHYPELANKDRIEDLSHIVWANGSTYLCKICNKHDMNNLDDFLQHIKEHKFNGLLDYKDQFGDLFSQVDYTICYICGDKLIQDYAEILSHLQMHHKEHSIKSYYDEFINESLPTSWDLSQCISDPSLDTVPKASTSEDNCSLNEIYLEIINDSYDIDKFHNWVNKCSIICKHKSCLFNSKVLEVFHQHVLNAHNQAYPDYCQLYNIEPSNPWIKTIFTICKLCATAIKNNKDDVESHMKACHNISGLIYYLENIDSKKENDNKSTSESLSEQLDAALQDINKENNSVESDESDLEILVDSWERKKRCIEVNESESIVMDVRVDL